MQLVNPNPIIMGILNVTTDSFSDGGAFIESDKAITHAKRLLDEGADIIDIGGESTRPGADSVSVNDELGRIIPVIQYLKNNMNAKISVDTQKPEVMAEVIGLGVEMINDVNALQAPGALEVVSDSNVDICLMHRKGSAKDMQDSPHYHNVVEEVYAFLQRRIEACTKNGIDLRRISVDVGFGFGKTDDHNLQLINNLHVFKSLGVPILIGVSRKSTLGRLLKRQERERLAGSLALALLSYLNGGDIFRVHDVKETYDALKVAELTVCRNKILNMVN